MSEAVQLPPPWLAYARTLAIPNVGDAWADYVRWMGDHGHELSEASWKKWCDRRKPKAAETKDAPVIRYPEWHQPTTWETEKATTEHALSAAEQILANLNALGGKPVHAQPTKADAPIDPVCVTCGRLCETGASRCARCKESGAPAPPADAHDASETEAAKPSDAGNHQPEEAPDGIDENQTYDPGPEPEGFFESYG